MFLLDNCEHVLRAAAELTDDLLRTYPDLRVLPTSREMLGTGGRDRVACAAAGFARPE